MFAEILEGTVRASMSVGVIIAAKVTLKMQFLKVIVPVFLAIVLLVNCSGAFPSRLSDYDAGEIEVPKPLQSRGPTPDNDFTDSNETRRKFFEIVNFNYFWHACAKKLKQCIICPLIFVAHEEQDSFAVVKSFF